MKRYEIRWTALDPTRGAEMAKTRPGVIVSLYVSGSARASTGHRQAARRPASTPTGT